MSNSSNQSFTTQSVTDLPSSCTMADEISNENTTTHSPTSTSAIKLKGTSNNEHNCCTVTSVFKPSQITHNPEQEEVFSGCGTYEKAPLPTSFRRRNYFRNRCSGSSSSKNQTVEPRTKEFMMRRENGVRRLLDLSDRSTRLSERDEMNKEQEKREAKEEQGDEWVVV